MTRPGETWVDFDERLLRFDDGVVQRRVRPIEIDIRDQFAKADGSSDDSIPFTNAVAALPAWGGRIIVPGSGSSYHFDDQCVISKNNVEIILEPGAHIERDPGTTVKDEPFLFTGVAPAAWDDLTADPSAGDVVITVTTPGDFTAGDWIKIKDEQTPYSGSGTHWETNRVRSKSGSDLTLEYPLCDDYATVATDAPSVSTFTPVIGSGIVGAGKITNGDTSDATAGNAGVRFAHAVGGYVRGIEFQYCQQDAIRYFDSYMGEFTGNYIHDASNFDGSGRGVTVGRSQHVIVANNRISRMRHMVDISNFSRYVQVSGNTCRGAAESALMLHPDVKWANVTNNTVDGLYGLGAGAEWGTTSANGVHIGDANQHIRVTNNTIANCRASGVICWRDEVDDVIISGNDITNCNRSGNTVYQAGIVVAQLLSTTALGEGITVKGNNVTHMSGRGILIGGSKVVCEGNFVKDITSSGDSAGILVRPWTTSGTPDAVDQPVVRGNTIEDVVGYGIRVGQDSTYEVTNAEIVGNEIRNVSLSGIHALPAEVTGLHIEGNRIRDPNTGVSSSHGGIVCGISGNSDVASADLVIVDNKVWCGTSTRGIMTNVAGVILRGNQVFDSASFGIYLPSGASGQDCLDAIIENNLLVGNVTGIYVGDTINGTVTTPHLVQNTFVGNTTGMRFRAQCNTAILIDNYHVNDSTEITDSSSTALTILTKHDLTNYRKHILELQVEGNVGFYGTTPAAQSSAYTQTYSTTTRSNNNPNAATLTDSTGGTANQTVAAVSGSGDDTTINDNFADLVDEVNKLVNDMAGAKRLLNSIIDDFQSNGMFQ